MVQVTHGKKSIKTKTSLDYKDILGKAPKTTAREDKKGTTKLKHEN